MNDPYKKGPLRYRSGPFLFCVNAIFKIEYRNRY